jgi:hypothetical protein
MIYYRQIAYGKKSTYRKKHNYVDQNHTHTHVMRSHSFACQGADEAKEKSPTLTRLISSSSNIPTIFKV